MKGLRIILIVALLGVMLPGLSQFDKPGKPILSLEDNYGNKDCDTFRLYINRIMLKEDTMIRRPIYKINDTFLSRLFDSAHLVTKQLDEIFCKNPGMPNNYIKLKQMSFSSLYRQYSMPDDILLDSIKGICYTKFKSPIILYGINDSILYGFGIDKIIDSAYVRVSPIWEPEYWHEYVFFINAKERSSSRYQFGLFYDNKLVDIDTCEKLKWIKDVSRYNDNRCSSQQPDSGVCK